MIVCERELDRYLDESVAALLEFCDEVALLCDRDNGWSERLIGRWGADGARVVGRTHSYGETVVDFFAHEGDARQRLLEFTLRLEPTHVLAIDADEFVADGRGLRTLIAQSRSDVRVWPLSMLEVWEATTDQLCLRVDGGWRPQPVPAVWKVEPGIVYRFPDRALACGRVPTRVQDVAPAWVRGEILHFGWANEHDRQARYDRYVLHDGGQFHASAHLQSIMFGCDRVRLAGYDWPNGLYGRKHRILEHASAVPA